MGIYETMLFPMLFYSLCIDRKLKDDYPCITSSLLFGILLGTFLIPVIINTYSGILDQNFIVLDIVTFILSVILAFTAVYRLSVLCRQAFPANFMKLFVLLVAVCFFMFTYRPPDIGIFAVPNE